MHTDAVHVVVSCTARNQESTWSFVRTATSPGPPGTTTTSGATTSSITRSATMPAPHMSRWTRASAATNDTSARGTRVSTSYGPIASSAVKPSNSRIAISTGREATGATVTRLA